MRFLQKLKNSRRLGMKVPHLMMMAQPNVEVMLLEQVLLI